MTDFRDEVVAFIRRHVVGPHGGPDEVLEELPYRRYLSGTLYPQGAQHDETFDDEELDGLAVTTSEEGNDDPLTLANEWLPSSMGLSFRFEGAEGLELEVWGAAYRREGANRFVREPLAEPESPEKLVLRPNRQDRHSDRLPALGGRAQVDCLWRPFGDGWLVTVTLINPTKLGAGNRPDVSDCLHQAGIRCTPSGGRVLDYPSVERLVADPEDEELALLHRAARVFSVGHGVSVDWNVDGDGHGTVWTEFVPTHQLRPVTSSWDDAPSVLSLEFLADPHLPAPTLVGDLHSFVDRYERWIDELVDRNPDISMRLLPARDRLIGRLHRTLDRLRDGIRALDDPEVLKAFRLANLAMAMQMRHSKEDLGGRRRPRTEIPQVDTDHRGRDYRWRPFQLAFQLLTIQGLADPGHPDREVVDLIWFPTGGGKTEAYLAVAAFEILLRRLRHGDRGAGTTVITRYTLRLLTGQQFQRAATLICALELIRREHPVMGAKPITIGLWLGNDVTPNKFQDAKERLDEMKSVWEPANKFQLDRCPWCGVETYPIDGGEDPDAYGMTVANDSFTFHCVNEQCAFHKGLPVGVVDEELYLRPPTFLIATADKFASLPWESRCGAFFGAGGTALPPSLIIQDELHLLSGPLGTVFGVYERAVEVLAGLGGVRPKVIASTATIRRADEQVRRLFGAEVALFPPAGLSAGDSFFAKDDESRPGRRYVGVMSQSHTAATTNVQLGAALLLAPVEVPMTEAEQDALWTLVEYHNTLRELGRSLTQFRDDVPEMIKARVADQSNTRKVADDSIIELTSNVSGERLPELLGRLALPGEEKNGVSVAVTTNMLSVGVDVDRLGLMLMNGQPKSTAEYIQATSRVGRATVPGTVVTMLSATKPRDRSHYETFRAYHQALYVHVEPTSVTPFSVPARRRALHAALVTLVRHGAGLPDNADAGRFDSGQVGVKHVVSELEQRIRLTDPDHADAAISDLRALVEEWHRRAEDSRSGLGGPLYYWADGRQFSRLLKDFGSTGVGWETMRSMRSVDSEVYVELRGVRP